MELLNFVLFLSILKISLNLCLEGKNNCTLCHPLTGLCVKCDIDIYLPDNKGGCEYSRKCKVGNNYCFECSKNEKLCEICDKGYFPDKNGACSYTDNCDISYKGECLKCIDNFILIGDMDNYNKGIKICKPLDSEDFKNCENINTKNGLCELCKVGYFLNSGDKKCIKTENCAESLFGICKRCNRGYYLDKQQDKCILQEDIFIKCIQTLDGKTCDICEDGYFFDEENNCVSSNYCKKGYKNGKCKECATGYYLSKFDKTCTSDKNCFFGINDIGICEVCIDGYYMDFKDGKCKSYEENEDFKYCRKANDGFCYECVAAFFLGVDKKCSSSKNCLEVENGICKVCVEDCHLGIDKICTPVEHCIKTSPFFDNCIECEDGYYFDNWERLCNIAHDIYRNCKSGNSESCSQCKDNFYLDQKENICYSNELKGKFYKCALSDSSGEHCIRCIDNYFLSYNNNLCIDTDGCLIAEDNDRCFKCNEYHCLNIKTGKCEINQYIEKEEQKIYLRCNQTNEEGNACEICKDENLSIKNGICVDNEHCIEKNEDGFCNICQNNNNGTFCHNDIFGCVEIYSENCLECNDILNLDICTKCIDGYEINEDGDCVEIS